MLIVAEKLLSHLGPDDDSWDGRNLYSSALFISSMLFMTAGYGEIMPNSSLTLLIMALQFVTYLVMFVFMVPFSRRNRTRHRRKSQISPSFIPVRGMLAVSMPSPDPDRIVGEAGSETTVW